MKLFDSLCYMIRYIALAIPFTGLPLVVRGEDAPTKLDQTEKIDWDWTGDQAAVNQQIATSLRQQVEALFEQMSPEAIRGYRHLTESVYLPADFDSEVFSELTNLDENPPFTDIKKPAVKHAATMLRFGLSPRPESPTKPLQYVVTKDNNFVMNCFACHGGNMFGATYPGAPNNLYALESLTEQVRKTKLRLHKPLQHMDVGSIFMPLGTSVGTSNAVMFGVALMNYRDAELNVHPMRAPARMVHHDMDAPPWWHFHRKKHIYIDGFAEKSHRGLMQFMMVKENGPEQFRGWENDFRDIYAFLSELRPPKYPLPVDQQLAGQGRVAFEAHCSSCHGTYGSNPDYKEPIVPIEEIGTDAVRLKSLSKLHRESYGQSWFADFGKQDTRSDVAGYAAPPLNGIWASPPYLHNGSVPTLWHVLHPEERPSIWRRTGLGLDVDHMGLTHETVDSVPPKLSPYQRRWYFDTNATGKSSKGHDFPAALSESEKRAVLEYLKTL
jgi:mono/diheme cytochrome c family protein